jgi:MFS family permease
MKTEDAGGTGVTGVPAQERAELGEGRAWYAVGILLVAYVFSIMDRQILTLLVGPIQHTLGVNDTLMGTLHGFTFAAFYALAGWPIARMIDRGDRRLVVAIGIATWSLATAAGGLATEYWHLLFSRIGVAVGEAVLIPGAVSLIADLFPARRRALAMTVFGASGPIGSGLGLVAGGAILGMFTLAPPVLPWLGALHPWQAVFILLGIPGLVVALLMLAVPEPRNGQGTRPAPGERRPEGRESEPDVPVRALARYLAENRRTVISFMVGSGFFYACVYGWTSWAPTYFVREFGWKYSEIGLLLGVMFATAGPAGALLGGGLGTFLKGRGIAHAYLWVAIAASVGLTVSTLGMVTGLNVNLSIAGMACATCFSFFLFGAGPSAIQELAPGPVRAQFAALYTGVLNLLGAGCGPVAVGLLTDYVWRDPAAIKYSIGIICLVFGVLATLFFRHGFGPYRQTLKNAVDWRSALAPTPAPAGKTPCAQSSQ